MLSLFIDITQKYCHLALLDEKSIIKKMSIETHNNLTDLVLEYIKKILKQTKFKRQDIKRIYITIGPGSFTGIRVGSIIAKTWHQIYKCEIFTISSLLLQIKTQHALSILDARNNKFYIGEYVNFKPKRIPCVVNQEELKKLKEKYKKQEIFIDYQNIDVFQNVLFHYKHFQKQTNINQIKLLYIKPPV